ncbi:hypothetical protein ACFVH6_21615 [Spirillospora sp. NPDC127200]
MLDLDALPLVKLDLNGTQASGWACVVCRWRTAHPVTYTPLPTAVVVGVSDITGLPVRACRGRCTRTLSYSPPPSVGQQLALL